VERLQAAVCCEGRPHRFVPKEMVSSCEYLTWQLSAVPDGDAEADGANGHSPALSCSLTMGSVLRVVYPE